MKKLFALLLVLGMLLSFSACSRDEAEEDEPKPKPLYVLTQASYYDKDGICFQRYDYTYDNDAQLLELDLYLIERSDIYYPELDIYVNGYTEDSPLNLWGTVQREYDQHGNLAAYDDPKLLLYGTGGSYEWDYQDEKPEGYQFTYKGGVLLSNPVCFEYDKDGNLIRIYTEQEGQESDNSLFEYDKQGRLTREIAAFRDGIVLEKNYTYKNGHLSSVQLRTGVCYYGDGSDHWDDDLHIQYTLEFIYDGKLLTQAKIYDADGEKVAVRNFSYNKSGHPTETQTIVYSDEGQETETETYTTDAMGNILTVEHEDGSRVEYTYEAMEVTAQQKTNYRRRLGFDTKSYNEDSVFFCVYRDFACCNLIPNPLFDLPYWELLD